MLVYLVLFRSVLLLFDGINPINPINPQQGAEMNEDMTLDSRVLTKRILLACYEDVLSTVR